MTLPFQRAGDVTAPTAESPIGQILQRVMALRDRSPSPAVLRAVAVLGSLTRAEDAVRKGLTGELLDQVIAYLEVGEGHRDRIVTVMERVGQLPAAVAETGFC
jgi:hypothetical protein